VSPFAGKPAESSMLVNVPKLITAYYTDVPDLRCPEQRIAFAPQASRLGFQKAFNEWHILAISQAICLYRGQQRIDGRCFSVWTRTRSRYRAFASALEVLAANGVDVMIAEGDEYTPTLSYLMRFSLTTAGARQDCRRRRDHALAQSPHDGGFKYTAKRGTG